MTFGFFPVQTPFSGKEGFMLNITEIKNRADISKVFAALGGEMRGKRGNAFWRGSQDFNLSLDAEKGLWHDFVSGEGGDVFKLVETALGCDFRGALEWLAGFIGVALSGKTPNANCGSSDSEDAGDWRADLEWSAHWARAARIIAEEVLAALPSWSPYRGILTDLLRAINVGEASCVAEYRTWRRRDPAMTTALAHAGKRADARLQRRLALWIQRTYGPATS
jgi:hypothetical protein